MNTLRPHGVFTPSSLAACRSWFIDRKTCFGGVGLTLQRALGLLAVLIITTSALEAQTTTTEATEDSVPAIPVAPAVVPEESSVVEVATPESTATEDDRRSEPMTVKFSFSG
ncbi:MAG: hypothetical protein AAGJ83_07925, partial [Planctomycetota bacterium]